MIFTNLKYQKDLDDPSKNMGVHCKINGEQTYVRIGDDSHVWIEIKAQVDAGNLTIEEAD
tara:strand:- start:1440 stop:1619 length:180 start_codon:yes stop_codon:yes gene_type:complete